MDLGGGGDPADLAGGGVGEQQGAGQGEGGGAAVGVGRVRGDAPAEDAGAFAADPFGLGEVAAGVAEGGRVGDQAFLAGVGVEGPEPPGRVVMRRGCAGRARSGRRR